MLCISQRDTGKESAQPCQLWNNILQLELVRLCLGLATKYSSFKIKILFPSKLFQTDGIGARALSVCFGGWQLHGKLNQPRFEKKNVFFFSFWRVIYPSFSYYQLARRDNLSTKKGYQLIFNH